MISRALLTALLLAAPPLVALSTSELAWAAGAAPSPSARALAAKLKRDGDAAMVELRYDEALAAYSQAYELAQDPALLYNRGRALQALGRFPEALGQLEAFDAEAPAQLKSRVPALRELITDVRARVTTLSLTCNVDGARIIIGDKVVGTTPLSSALKLNAGPTALQIEAEGYDLFRRIVDLPGGGESRVNAELSLKTKKGILVVRSSIAGVRVSVDGRIVGNAPAEVSLRAGPHKLLLERDGYLPASTLAIVAAGDREEVTVPLRPVPPVTTRWWFWTGIGAAIIAGAVVTAAALTERSVEPGTIEPGKASAPIRF